MTDRELLELAAKAAAMTLGAWREDYGAFMYRDAAPGRGYWNPLTDDGDALRLAVKLNIGVMPAQYTGQTCAWLYCKGRDGEFFEPHGDDPDRATRRAIVRAAANIGEQQCRT